MTNVHDSSSLMSLYTFKQCAITYIYASVSLMSLYTFKQCAITYIHASVCNLSFPHVFLVVSDNLYFCFSSNTAYITFENVKVPVKVRYSAGFSCLAMFFVGQLLP